MDRNGIFAVIFVILLFSRGSESSFSEFLRVLAGENTNGKVVSPSPSPKGDKSNQDASNLDPNPSKSDQNPKVSEKTDGKGSQGSQASDGNTAQVSQSGGKGENDKPHEKIKGDVKCEALTNGCMGKQKLIANLCNGTGTQELYIRVNNGGEYQLTVNIKVPDSVKVEPKELLLAQHQERKINVTSQAIGDLRDKIIVDCVGLADAPTISSTMFVFNLPSYANQMTPLYGAYILFLTVLIVGVIWACCKFGREGRRGNGEIPYQELEMGLPPQSSSAIEADSTDGWDQGWDDNWEEEKGIARPSEIRPVGNVSVNGLKSRSPNTEGWDDDWDD
ncbi:uncharacterized protein LOC143872363 [Tasmannia lanceolata]|uniref:uncharacterized protein LOC143872363 n=1 Tax=Tasmannia lanceolata TaxID=3420 RepID=UPI004063F5C1